MLIYQELIIALKKYIHKHSNVKINPIFALIKLCTRDGIMDLEKFQDFKLRIDFFEQLPIKVFIRLKYDFHKDIKITNSSP